MPGAAGAGIGKENLSCRFTGVMLVHVTQLLLSERLQTSALQPGQLALQSLYHLLTPSRTSSAQVLCPFSLLLLRKPHLRVLVARTSCGDAATRLA